jgi:hypothetical protein
MATGTTIQVFLPDGNPRSLKIAGITSRAVLTILIERANLGKCDFEGASFLNPFFIIQPGG